MIGEPVLRREGLDRGAVGGELDADTLPAMSRSPADVPLWPVRRLLDPRFADLARRLNDVSAALRGEVQVLRADIAPLESAVQREILSTREIATHVRDRLDAAEQQLAAIEQRLTALGARLDRAAR